MKILLLIDSLGSGGAQRQMVTLASLLKEQGQNVSFLLYADEPFFQNEVENLNIPIHLILTKSYMSRIWQVRKYIRNGKFDAVISFMDTPNFLNNFAAIGGKSWKVITSERSSQEDFLLSRRGKAFGWFQRFSDVIVCNSYNAKAIWEKHYPQYKHKLSVIYNPVLLPKITEEYIPKRNGKVNVVIAASYQYLKNPLGLIEAIRLLSNEEKEKLSVNWYGRIEVTNGDTRAYDESVLKIKEYKLDNILTLNAPTKDVSALMHKADVVALLSELEGLPNAICEGMSIGKPILMTKVSDYQELVDSSNGVLCDWDNPDSITSSLRYMMERTENEILSMGHASQKKANRLFSKGIISEKWINLVNHTKQKY
ncbi:glycosyltransferase [Kaistella rhinocerotis]|uniref:glycosyltransferase n=1 Tax=Kaistella rhinocerotis TaxID=3026437 RepID=UPI002552E517|nr:glycosyltransferase [Kaistella sp. Ran72]